MHAVDLTGIPRGGRRRVDGSDDSEGELGPSPEHDAKQRKKIQKDLMKSMRQDPDALSN